MPQGSMIAERVFAQHGVGTEEEELQGGARSPGDIDEIIRDIRQANKLARLRQSGMREAAP